MSFDSFDAVLLTEQNKSHWLREVHHLNCCSTWLFFQEPPEDQPEEDQEILPGGDPDAGMPADQAEIHGTERVPVESAEEGDHTERPSSPPVTDVVDNIDEVDITVGNTDSNVSQQLQETD